MKQLSIFFFSTLFFLLTSCTDPCENIECQNGGTCNEGDCECVEGYSGTDCSTENRLAFIGNWTGMETCSDSSNNEKSLKILKIDSDITKIHIEYDNDPELFSIANVTSSTTYTSIPDTVDFFGTILISTSEGKLEGEQLYVKDIVYLYENGTKTETINCDAILNK